MRSPVTTKLLVGKASYRSSRPAPRKRARRLRLEDDQVTIIIDKGDGPVIGNVVIEGDQVNIF